MLTHDNLVAGVCSAIRAMQVSDDDEQYLFLPLAHVLGRELEWAAIAIGCETVILARRARSIKEDLRRDAARPSWRACRASSRSSSPA